MGPCPWWSCDQGRSGRTMHESSFCSVHPCRTHLSPTGWRSSRIDRRIDQLWPPSDRPACLSASNSRVSEVAAACANSCCMAACARVVTFLAVARSMRSCSWSLSRSSCSPMPLKCSASQSWVVSLNCQFSWLMVSLLRVVSLVSVLFLSARSL